MQSVLARKALESQLFRLGVFSESEIVAAHPKFDVQYKIREYHLLGALVTFVTSVAPCLLVLILLVLDCCLSPLIWRAASQRTLGRNRPSRRPYLCSGMLVQTGTKAAKTGFAERPVFFFWYVSR